MYTGFIFLSQVWFGKDHTFNPSSFLPCRGAHIDVRNKKGNTPLWLSANGGHFDVVQLLEQAGADVDAADNRKITPLMAAFRKVRLV